MKCPNCGFEDPEDPEEFAYCSQCGQPRIRAESGTQRESRPAAGGVASAKPVAAVEADRPPLGSRTARLVGMEGPINGQEFVLARAEMSIGRQSTCDVVIPDATVSRLHAWVRLVGDRYFVEDAGSTHGTWVNGVRLSEARPLAEPDIIQVGTASFSFRVEGQGGDVPPGSMTIVADVGQGPAAFEETASVAPASVRGPTQAVAPTGESLSSLQEELAKLERDLEGFVQRLKVLTASLAALAERLPAGSPTAEPASPLRQFVDELKAAGGPGRYRELHHLLEDVRAQPTDVRSLARLSDELPTIISLVELYLRTVQPALERERSS
jgi:pSer/pThr/pTyr-binding forkhead associated (FHA) protein